MRHPSPFRAYRFGTTPRLKPPLRRSSGAPRERPATPTSIRPLSGGGRRKRLTLSQTLHVDEGFSASGSRFSPPTRGRDRVGVLLTQRAQSAAETVPATRWAPELCQTGEWRVASGDMEETLFPIRHSLFRHSRSPCLAIRHDKEKKEAERRQTCSANLRALRARRAPLFIPSPACGGGLGGARSPIGVPPRLLPSGLSSLRRNSRPGFLGRGRTFDPVRPHQPGCRDLALFHGRYPRRLSQSRECTSRTGHSAGQMMPKAARERSVSFRPRAPHSLHLQEYPRPKASFTERDSFN